MKHYKFFILITFLAFLGLVFYPLGIMPIKGLVFKSFTPVAKGVYDFTLGAKNLFNNIRMISSLTKTNEQLEQENQLLKSEKIKWEEISHQNEILTEELGFSQKNQSTTLIPAQVIGFSPSGFTQILIINKGGDEGIQKGKPVVSNGFLIGTISQVYVNNSEITLINNNKSLIPVVLQDSRGTGLLKGGLEGLSIQEIPVNCQIKIDEQVLTSGLGGDLPADLPIGQVKKIISKESEIFQQVEVVSPININKLEVIFVYQ